MYFPGALRNAANQEATVSGADVAAAVRASLHLGPSNAATDDS
jgi:hypothetical protein